jgi:pre-rRNA-processing protein TSR3
MLRQDEPSKCTAAKLTRFGLVRRITSVSHNTLLLDPFSKDILSRQDSKLFNSICAIDCSWENAEEVLTNLKELRRCRKRRRLPAMLAANPTNYSKLGKLSSAEALAGSLYILGYKENAEKLLNKFKWGHTFLQLNHDLLEDYSNAENPEIIADVEKQYFGQLYYI